MTSRISLRVVWQSDLAIFFEQQLDEEANRMAAFTAKDPADRPAFDAHWAKMLADPTLTARTILYGGQVAGHVACHRWFGEPEVTYWMGKEFWGRGIATQALKLLLEEVAERPLHARVAKDNVASRRVLEKCGFAIIGEDRGFANARGAEVEEYLLKLA